MHKTGSNTVQKKTQTYVGHLRRTFRTRGRQTSILEAVARPKKSVFDIHYVSILQTNSETFSPNMKETYVIVRMIITTMILNLQSVA